MGDVERAHFENINETVADSARYESVTRQMDHATGSTHEAVVQQRREHTRGTIVADIAQQCEQSRFGLGLLTECGEYASSGLAIGADEGRLRARDCCAVRGWIGPAFQMPPTRTSNRTDVASWRRPTELRAQVQHGLIERSGPATWEERLGDVTRLTLTK
jgi:hypothetical protein